MVGSHDAVALSYDLTGVIAVKITSICAAEKLRCNFCIFSFINAKK